MEKLFKSFKTHDNTIPLLESMLFTIFRQIQYELSFYTNKNIDDFRKVS